MGYFTSMTDWILSPLKEYNTNFATLNIDQAIDLLSDQRELSKSILDDYTTHWLGRLFDKIQQQNSLSKQDEITQSDNKTSYRFIKNLSSSYKIENKTFNYVFTFISDKEKIEKNEFFQEVKKACISENIHPNFHSAQIMEIAGRNKEFDRGKSCTLVFPLKYEAKFSYSNISGNYLANLISVQISSIANIKDKKILISFDFLKGLPKNEKKRFFRALIRSLLQTFYQTYKINFENITILVASDTDIRLFNSAIDDLMHLLDYNSTITDWSEFYSKHPLNTESQNKTYMEREYGYNQIPDPSVGNQVTSDDTGLTNIVLKEISTSDQAFIDELLIVEKVIDVDDDNNILLLGETGVGKSFLAEKIHKASNRSALKMGVINCSAIPETLIEGELFGWEKGAHQGADEIRYGYIEQANDSTLFIDEIGKAPLSVQQKLLIFLDKKYFHRLGGKAPIKVNVRLIFASNDNLGDLIKQRKFLLEFYYRIANFSITIPPLRKRPSDIEKFIILFKNNFEEKYKWKVTLTGDVISVLKSKPWYGNMRELKTTIQLLVVLNSIKEGSIELEDLEKVLHRVEVENTATGITDLNSLEEALLEFFKKWLNEKEKIQEEVLAIYKRFGMKGPSDNQKSFGGSIILPILAKIFQENKDYLGFDQGDASETIGISWSGTKDNSTLVQKLNLYPIVEKYFKD